MQSGGAVGAETPAAGSTVQAMQEPPRGASH